VHYETHVNHRLRPNTLVGRPPTRPPHLAPRPPRHVAREEHIVTGYRDLQAALLAAARADRR